MATSLVFHLPYASRVTVILRAAFFAGRRVSAFASASAARSAEILRFAQDDSRISKLAALKFRSAQHQPGDHAQIHLLAQIIELGLQNLRIIELFLERLDGGRSRL